MSLLLDNSCCGDEGLKRAFDDHPSLESVTNLSLASCNITSLGLSHVSELIRESKLLCLTTISLEWNPNISSDMTLFTDFCRTISRTKLQTLSFRECGLSRSCEGPLGELVSRSHLKSIDIAHNNLSPFAIICNSHSLTKCEISGTGCSSVERKKVADRLERNSQYSNPCLEHQTTQSHTDNPPEGQEGAPSLGHDPSNSGSSHHLLADPTRGKCAHCEYQSVLRVLRQNFEEEKFALNGKIRELSDSQESLKNSLHKSQTRVKDLTHEVAALDESKTAILTTYQTQLQSLQEKSAIEINQSNTYCKSVESDLRVALAENESLQSKVDLLEDDLQQLRDRAMMERTARVTREESLLVEIESNRNEVLNLHKDISVLQAGQDKLVITLNSQTDEITKLTNINSLLKSQLDEIHNRDQSHVHDLKTQIHQLTEELLSERRHSQEILRIEVEKLKTFHAEEKQSIYSENMTRTEEVEKKFHAQIELKESEIQSTKENLNFEKSKFNSFKDKILTNAGYFLQSLNNT